MIRSAVFVPPLDDVGVRGLGVAPEVKVLAEADVVGVCEDVSVVEVGPALAKLGGRHAMAS